MMYCGSRKTGLEVDPRHSTRTRCIVGRDQKLMADLSTLSQLDQRGSLDLVAAMAIKGKSMRGG
jgi:hypothetical protein